MNDATTETKRFKNRIKKESGLPATATVLAVLALGCVCGVYWPVFARFNAGGMQTDPTVYPMTVIYGLLFSALLLYTLFTGLFAKRSLIPAAICAVPVFLYYFIEKVGVLEYLVFHTSQDLFFVYENNPSYYSGQNLLWIILAAVFSLLAMFAFLTLCFHKKKGKILNTVIILVAFVVRAYYAYYHLAHNEFVLYKAGTYSLADISYAVLGHVASVLFFGSVLLLAFAMRKTELVPKHLAKAEPVEVVPAQRGQSVVDAQPVQPIEAVSAPVEENTVVGSAHGVGKGDKLADIAYNREVQAESAGNADVNPIVEIIAEQIKKPRKRNKKAAAETAAAETAPVVEAAATEVETTTAE